VGDVETAGWVSKSIGSTAIAYQAAGASVSKAPGPFLSQTSTGASTANHLSRRKLLTPNEAMRLDANLEILLRQGAAPVVSPQGAVLRCSRIPYRR
jgi:type IV secretion system protein VirD4